MPHFPFPGTSLHSIANHRKFRRLSLVIIAAMCIGLLLPALVGGMILTNLRHERMISETNQDLDGKLRLLANSLVNPVWNVDTRGTKSIVAALLLDTQVVRIAVLEPDLTKFVTMEHPERRTGTSTVARREIQFEGQVIGLVEVEIDDTLKKAEVERDHRAYYFVLIGQFLLSLLLAVLVIRVRILAPLARLSGFSDQLSNGDLDQPIGWSQSDEIGRLAFQMDQMREALRASFAKQLNSENKLGAIFNASPTAMSVLDANDGCRIISINAAWERQFGYKQAEIAKQNELALWGNASDREMIMSALENNTGVDGMDAEMITAQGQQRLCRLSTQIAEIGQQRLLLMTAVDITALREYQKQLEHMAHYDVLTTLPNRALLADRMRQAMVQAQRREERLAVIYMDIDGFKLINDGHGHEAGDQLLIALADRMKNTLRGGDTLARLGGDEFIFVLLDLDDLSVSAQMMNRLLATIAQPIQVGELCLQVSASLGVTFYPQADAVDADQLLRQADQAMYQAKLAGKNRYHIFDAEQDRSTRGYHESLDHIRQALAASEFVLYYQPKVNMRTGEVVGAEALIRWQHPERGLLPPAAFLPAIENHPLAVDLGEWVIDTALTQVERWNEANLHIPVSVNVGAWQLQSGDFSIRLRTILAKHPRVRPSDLQIEILETSALQDLAHVSKIIEDCRSVGINFSLDDFGTGYSSLTYLRHLSASQIKIDQSFVRDMLDDPDDLTILGGILGLAKAFGRQVIAEGVETVAHGTMLLHMGCELAQGYGIARPMPASEFPAWAEKWAPDPIWRQISSEDHEILPLLFAVVEHRAWYLVVEDFLLGKRDVLPTHQRDTRFDKWLSEEGHLRHGSAGTFQKVADLHCQVHNLADQLCEARSSGQNFGPPERLDELRRLRDALLDNIERFLADSRRQ